MSNLYQTAAELPITEKSSDYAGKVKSNLISPIFGAYANLLNWGVQTAEAKNQGKYIRITNFIALNTFFGSLIYVVLAVFWGNWSSFFTNLPLSLASLAVLFINRLGKINLSRITLLVGVNILIFINSLYDGPAAETKSFFIIALIIPFLIYDIRDFTFIVTGVVIPVFLAYMYSLLAPYFINYNLALEQQMITGKINMGLEFLLALSAVYQFVHYTRKAEDALEASAQIMSLQTKELKRSNADLEQFAYIISHDLKAPARNISSFMTLLSNKHAATMSPEAREFVNFSVAGAKRMERLIEDLLSYCRMGTNLPPAAPVNLNDVINTLQIELQDKLTAANGTIVVKNELPVLNNVHPTLMYHIFQNLIANGLKFNKSGKPEIDISWTQSPDYYTFFVQDNGIGISKQYSTAIFQMFKRLHTESEYEGTGIGLAICKRIVEYYHGEIGFESEVGKGTAFHFTIRK